MPLKLDRLVFSFLLQGLLVLSLSLFAGCAGNKVSPSVDGGVAVEEPPLDSLRAKFKLTIVQNDGEQDLDAVLFSVPGKRYRLELMGPMGIGVASLLWTKEGWTMTFPTEKRYVNGVGYMVGLLNDRTLPLVHIHQVASFFEGRLLPEKYEVLDSLAGFVNGVDETGRRFSYEIADSHVKSLTYTGRDGKLETLRFFDFRDFEGKVLPERIVFELGGRRFLEIKIKKVAHGKPFSGGTWKLNVPRSFKPVE